MILIVKRGRKRIFLFYVKLLLHISVLSESSDMLTFKNVLEKVPRIAKNFFISELYIDRETA